MNEEFDFIALGDIVTDAFIRIKQASIHHDDPDGLEKICLTNGSKIPYEFFVVLAAVGNSPNAAVSATRLGLKTALVTNLGDDEYGKEDIETLNKNGIDTRFVRVHPGQKSNYHFVLWHKAERTILIKHEEYPYSLPDIGTPRWMYLSSLGENSLTYHDEIAQFLVDHPSTKLAFQPGTFQIKLGKDRLQKLYGHTEVFFCNKEEAQLILGTQEDSIPALARELSKTGPKVSVITDGPKGAFAFDGADVWFMPPYPDIAPPYERTGAGDAFASTFTSALALGKSVSEALMWGPINSMMVVQKIGAQEGLMSREQLEEFLAKRPADYEPKKVG